MRYSRDTRLELRLLPCVPVLRAMTSHSLVLLSLVLIAACGSDTTAVKLVLTQDEEVNSPAEVATAIGMLEVVVDSPDGIRDVTAAGPTGGGGTAIDWDQDGVLEVSFVTDKGAFDPLPVLEIGLSSNSGRDLEFSVLGYNGSATHQLVDAAALGRVTARCNAGEVRTVGMPFNLRASARPPRVIMMLPTDGDVNVPTTLAYISLVFSTRVTETSLAAEVQLVGDRQGAIVSRLVLTDAVFVDAGNVSDRRSVLQIFPTWDPLGDSYTLTVGTGVKSDAGRRLDQVPDRPGAEPFVGWFSVPPTIGGPPGGGECPEGYVSVDGGDSCAPIPSCNAGCGTGFVCDTASATCVDDCRLFGGCPIPGSTCDLDSGLCR